MPEIKNGYVKMSVFRLLVSIFITVLFFILGGIGVSISAIDSKVDKNEDVIHSVDKNVATTMTEIKEINKKLDKLLK